MRRCKTNGFRQWSPRAATHGRSNLRENMPLAFGKSDPSHHTVACCRCICTRSNKSNLNRRAEPQFSKPFLAHPTGAAENQNLHTPALLQNRRTFWHRKESRRCPQTECRSMGCGSAIFWTASAPEMYPSLGNARGCTPTPMQSIPSPGDKALSTDTFHELGPNTDKSLGFSA